MAFSLLSGRGEEMHHSRKKIWGTVAEAAQHLGKDADAIVQSLIPSSYHRQRKEGHIRFRVIASFQRKRRVPLLWWEDVLAMCAARPKKSRARALRRNNASQKNANSG